MGPWAQSSTQARPGAARSADARRVVGDAHQGPCVASPAGTAQTLAALAAHLRKH